MVGYSPSFRHGARGEGRPDVPALNLSSMHGQNGPNLTIDRSALLPPNEAPAQRAHHQRSPVEEPDPEDETYLILIFTTSCGLRRQCALTNSSTPPSSNSII